MSFMEMLLEFSKTNLGNSVAALLFVSAAYIARKIGISISDFKRIKTAVNDIALGGIPQEHVLSELADKTNITREKLRNVIEPAIYEIKAGNKTNKTVWRTARRLRLQILGF